jgi:hypothetical protein
MATIVESTIGSGGDYPDIVNWFGGAPSSLVSADVIWKGNIIENTSFDDFGLSLKTTDTDHYFWITADDTVKHTGEAGTGVKILATGFASEVVNVGEYAIIENLEIDCNNDSNVGWGIKISGTQWGKVRNCIIHSMQGNGPICGIYRNISGSLYVENTLIYDIRNTNTGYPWESYGIFVNDNNNNDIEIHNCTIDKVTSDYDPYPLFSVYASHGIYGGTNGTGNREISNCIITNTSNVDFNTTSSYACSNNISSDGTAPGSDSHTSINSSTLYADEAGDDYHLKYGAIALQNGIDLSSKFTDSIDSVARPSATLWDIGAFEYPFYESIFEIVEKDSLITKVNNEASEISLIEENNSLITIQEDGSGTVTKILDLDSPLNNE